MSSLPGWDALRKLDQGGDGFGGAIDPGLERFPILGRNGDDGAVEHFGLRGFQRPASHKVAEVGVRLFGRRFKNGPFGGIDPDAQYRGGGGGIHHAYDNSTRGAFVKGISIR